MDDYYDRKLRCYGPLMVLVLCLTFWVLIIWAVMAAGKAWL